MVKDSVFHFAVPSRPRVAEHYFYAKTGNFIAYKDATPIGFISACIVPFFFSDYERACDLGFYVCPAHRGGSAAIRLLHTREKWAKQMGAKEFCMGQSLGGKVDQMRSFYERNGYTVCGFNSMKDL
jgi:GNAT superfamily N-acetyltransferase